MKYCNFFAYIIRLKEKSKKKNAHINKMCAKSTKEK